MSRAPIGIFDSGIGGLTVAKEIAKQLPNNQIIYFGDTAHAPWGDKSATIINQYASQICQFLIDQGCKHIVVACNTASAICLPHIEKVIRKQATLHNVIDPVIDYLSSKNYENIGLIGTKQTIAANSYPTKARYKQPNYQFKTLATPLLVPLIEEGLIQHPATNIILSEYLSNPSLTNIQALILGCTHYPLLKDQIDYLLNSSKLIEQKVDIIDCAKLIAISLHDKLYQSSTDHDINFTNHFYLSDDNQFFCNAAEQFFCQGKSKSQAGFKIEKISLWD